PMFRAIHEWRRGEASDSSRRGLSPHAPYSLRWALMQMACSTVLPVTIHWLESPGERELIENHSGPFVPFLQDLGVLDGGQLIPGNKFRLAHAGLHSPAVLLAHANYQSPDALWRPNTAIAYCPRTHAAFGHPPHPFREFLKRGVRVALGTDSLASNPDLSVLAEARFVHRLYPDFPGDVLLRMATLSGAEALGGADETGRLTPDKPADL